MLDTFYLSIAKAYAKASDAASGLKTRFRAAGFDPTRISSLEDLSRLPAVEKEELLKLQRGNRLLVVSSLPTPRMYPASMCLRARYLSPLWPVPAVMGLIFDLLFRPARSRKQTSS
jgi:hypothetical protein